MKKILLFGYGYVTHHLSSQLLIDGWDVMVTSRHKKTTDEKNLKVISFYDPNIPALLQQVDAIISTIPPCQGIDPVLDLYQDALTSAACPYIGYLSSTSVYGDHQGGWVNEATACLPTSSRANERWCAEQAWQDLYRVHQLPVHIFRLAGIYGPGRHAFLKLKAQQPVPYRHNHTFSRIHVEDIIQVLQASCAQPTPGEIYNLADDEPANLLDVYRYAAQLMQCPPPATIAYDDTSISPGMRLFFQDNKRVANEKVRRQFDIRWYYPDYRSGLTHEFNRGIS